MRTEIVELKQKLYAACKHLNIKTIEVRFDGSGDSGQIESVHFYDGNGNSVEPTITLGDCSVVIGQKFENGEWTNDIETQNLELIEAVEEIVYALLEKKYSGWEINEGSYGEFVFDVKENKITCQFVARVTENNLHIFPFNDEVDNTTEE